jgi:hypothetical protein
MPRYCIERGREIPDGEAWECVNCQYAVFCRQCAKDKVSKDSQKSDDFSAAAEAQRMRYGKAGGDWTSPRIS